MKKYVRGLLLLLALLCLATPVAAAMPEPTDRFFVNDFANVLSSEAEEDIYAAGVQLFEKTGAQAVVVTVDSLDGRDIREYGLSLGRQWGVGDDEKNTGVVLLLSVGDREVTIEVGYGLEGAITDARSGIILDNYAIPYFSKNDFEEGLQETYNAIINEVYLEFGLEADPNYVPADNLESEEDIETYIFFLIFVVMCIVVVVARLRGIPLFIGHGFHHHHHGGFGGGGFSGGGGGFRGGGGSFGGGGASRGF